MKLKMLTLFVLIPSMAFATPDFFNRLMQSLTPTSEEGARIPTEHLQIIQKASVSAGVELSQVEKQSLYSLMSYQEEEGEITFNDMKIRTVVTQILMSIGERSGGFSVESRSKEIQIFQNILRVLLDEKLQESELYWWPLIFLQYSLPFYSEGEIITVNQNLRILEELSKEWSEDGSMVEHLARLHTHKKTATYYLALGHRGLSNVNRLSQAGFDRLIKYLDSVFEGDAASRGVSNLNTVMSSARASFQEMDSKDKAVGVAKLAATTPFVGMKLRVLIWLGTVSYDKFDQMTGVQKAIAKTGLRSFLKNNPKVNAGVDAATQVSGIAGGVGRDAVGRLQRTGRRAYSAGLELNGGSLLSAPGSLLRRLWGSQATCRDVLKSSK